MSRAAPRVLALCFSLCIMPIVADDSGLAGIGNEAGGGAKSADGGRTDEAAAATADHSDGGASAGSATKGKAAGTGTAAGYVYDQVKKGNVNIHGATDTEIPLTQ